MFDALTSCKQKRNRSRNLIYNTELLSKFTLLIIILQT